MPQPRRHRTPLAPPKQLTAPRGTCFSCGQEGLLVLHHRETDERYCVVCALPYLERSLELCREAVA